MTQNWDEIKHKLEKFASNAADKATEFTRDAAGKAEKLTQKSKIKLDIFQLEKSRDKEYRKLGELISKEYSNDKEMKLSNVQGLNKIQKAIGEINQKIEEHRKKIKDIKDKKTDSEEG